MESGANVVSGLDRVATHVIHGGFSVVLHRLDLDVTLVEVADSAGLIELTDDGCGSTCGACTTNAA